MTAAVWLVGGPVVADRENLRYSLRSAATNMPWIGQVWIVGDVPSWLSDDVRTLPLTPQRDKWANIRRSLTAAVAHPDMADEVVVFSDDHYVIAPIDELDVPVFHLGSANRYITKLLAEGFNPRNTWLAGLRDTTDWLISDGRAGTDPACYDAHAPIPFDRQLLADALNRYPTDQRLCYPQLYPIAGTGSIGQGGNVKVRTDTELADKLAYGMPYLSSGDDAFTTGAVGRYIRDLFPSPSKFERS